MRSHGHFELSRAQLFVYRLERVSAWWQACDLEFAVAVADGKKWIIDDV